jgi:hypothetical protein
MPAGCAELPTVAGPARASTGLGRRQGGHRLTVSARWRWMFTMSSRDDAAQGQALDRADPEQAKVRGEALDLLIEQELKLAAVYDARQSSADSRAAAALTAAFALLSVAAAVAKEAGDTPHWAIYVALAAIALLAVAAVASRVLAGIRFRRASASAAEGRERARASGGRTGERREPLLSAEGESARHAREDLWSGQADGKSANEVRELALTLWRGRAQDAREGAIAREKWAGGTAVLLALAVLVSVAVVVFSIAG